MLTGTRALWAIFSSVSSSYGFTIYDGGSPVRGILYADAEPVYEVGEPLAVESAVGIPEWGPDEDFVWAVTTEVTGLAYDSDRQFEVYTLG